MNAILSSMMRFWLLFSAFVVSLRGELPNIEEELGVNATALRELLKLQANPFLQDLQGHWSFNETSDISKYEEFDHTRFQGSRELSLDELVEKVKEWRRTQRRRPEGPRSTTAPSLEEGPDFDPSSRTNITAQLGGTAYLSCRVRNLKNKAVSWVRRRDWHILTSATFTYTNDERFQVLHKDGSEEWILMIKYVQKRDGGEYECQVATGRGTLSRLFSLAVVVPTAYILGTGEYHIGHGSDISLACIIENSPTPPQFVMWYHNEVMINYEEAAARKEKVRVVTGPEGELTVSKLQISGATPRHSGNYSCRASNTQPDYVYVFVSTDGDNIAAIQRHNGAIPKVDKRHLMIAAVTLVCIVVGEW